MREVLAISAKELFMDGLLIRVLEVVSRPKYSKKSTVRGGSLEVPFDCQNIGYRPHSHNERARSWRVSTPRFLRESDNREPSKSWMPRHHVGVFLTSHLLPLLNKCRLTVKT